MKSRVTPLGQEISSGSEHQHPAKALVIDERRAMGSPTAMKPDRLPPHAHQMVSTNREQRQQELRRTSQVASLNPES
jgi:hypothetical protein